jgi:Lon protease-like protein
MSGTPMFPLGTVLFPSVVLPLHVFEPRYRALTAECIEREIPFGVVLIERGSEVGGGDLRTDVGTLARIVQAQPFPDGRWAIATVGTTRIVVRSWRDDAPYPLADVEELPDDEPTAATRDALDTTVALLRTVLATKAELGEPAAPATIELADDVTLASYQAAALSPFGPMDHQRLLAAPGADARLALLHDLLEEERSFLEVRLSMETPDESPD